MVELGFAEAGEGVLPSRTLRDRDVEDERHKDVLERVLEGNAPTPAPLPGKNPKTS